MNKLPLPAASSRPLASMLILTLLPLLLVGCTCGWCESRRDRLIQSSEPKKDPRAELRQAVTLHASFDHGIDADFAAGDPQLYHAPSSRERQKGVPGLPEGNAIHLAPDQGRYGQALYFDKKIRPVVFYRGAENLNYQATNWSGAASFWLRLDPDQDLEPGYCDPVQFVGQAWTEGNMFVEFSKDETPRHFRYAIMAITRLWNPDGKKWEEIPVHQRPMVQVEKPPFSREQWTHVAFTFENLNTGLKDGIGKLYLNGEYQGAFLGFEQTFNWDVTQSAITVGLNYVGFFDDLAIFNRPLTPEEVRLLYQLPGGVSDLLGRKK
jgi:hypothetical protein